MKLSPIYWVLSTAVLLAGAGLMGVGAAMKYNTPDEEVASFEEHFAAPENITIEVENCSLTLRSSQDANECTVQFINAPGNPKMYLDGDTLHVEQKRKRKLEFIHFGDWDSRGELIVTLPETALNEVFISLAYTKENDISAITCEKLELKCGLGDLKAEQLKVNEDLVVDVGTTNVVFKDVVIGGKWDMDFGVGNLDADNLVVGGDTDFDLGTGDCTLRNSRFADFNLDGGVGDLVCESMKLCGDAEIDCGTGDVTLDIITAPDLFSVEVDKATGSVAIDGQNITTLYNKYAEYMISVDCGVGDIDISFREE